MTEQNLAEWMRSTGYLLPQTPVEVQRFEILHAGVVHQVNIEDVDPVAIIQGSWVMRTAIKSPFDEIDASIQHFRMAARKHNDLPDDLIEKMKNNQKKIDGADHSQSSE